MLLEEEILNRLWIFKIDSKGNIFQVWDIVSKLQRKHKREVVLLELLPASAEKKKRYEYFYNKFKMQNRLY